MRLMFSVMTGILVVMTVCVVYILGKKLLRWLKSEAL